jgi:hypothetical protein
MGVWLNWGILVVTCLSHQLALSAFYGRLLSSSGLHPSNFPSAYAR